MIGLASLLTNIRMTSPDLWARRLALVGSWDASYRQRRTKCSATVAENWLFPRHIKHSAISSSVCPRRREVNC